MRQYGPKIAVAVALLFALRHPVLVVYLAVVCAGFYFVPWVVRRFGQLVAIPWVLVLLLFLLDPLKTLQLALISVIAFGGLFVLFRLPSYGAPRVTAEMGSLACGECAKPLALDEEIALCSKCGAPQHPKCFVQRKVCAAPACTGRRIVPIGETLFSVIVAIAIVAGLMVGLSDCTDSFDKAMRGGGRWM